MSKPGECSVGQTPCQIPQCAIDGNCILRRRESVIKLLERDVAEANARAARALGTRKVLFMLLGECLPLLEYDAQETHCGESHDQIIELAKQAGVSIRGHYDETGSTPAELQRFAELVRNEVLEEAAKVCDERFAACPQVLADAIRSLKK